MGRRVTVANTGLCLGLIFLLVIFSGCGPVTLRNLINEQVERSKLPVPTDLEIEPGNAELTLTWTGITEAEQYSLFWDTVPGVSSESNEITQVAPPYTHSPLENGTTYYYVVAALFEGPEWSFPSAEVSGSPRVPPLDPPIIQSVTAGDSAATVTWATVGGAVAYHIYWRNTDSAAVTKIPNVTSPYEHSALTNGTTYYYTVTAESPDGESDRSNEVSVTPLPTILLDYANAQIVQN